MRSGLFALSNVAEQLESYRRSQFCSDRHANQSMTQRHSRSYPAHFCSDFAPGSRVDRAARCMTTLKLRTPSKYALAVEGGDLPRSKYGPIRFEPGRGIPNVSAVQLMKASCLVIRSVEIFAATNASSSNNNRLYRRCGLGKPNERARLRFLKTLPLYQGSDPLLSAVKS